MVDMVTALQAGEPIRMRSPTALRPWQHVLQCLSGYLTIGAKLLGPNPERYCTAWNIGPLPGNEIPVSQVVRLFTDYWGGGEVRDVSDPSQPPEANILRLSIDKAIWELGWQPKWNVFKTLEKTAEWYRAYFGNGADMQQISMQQISEYEADLAVDEHFGASPIRAS